MIRDDLSLELKQKETGVKDSLWFVRHYSEELRRLLKGLLFFREEATTSSVPRIRVQLRPNQIILRANLPGLHKEELKVQVDDRLLIIQGQPQEREGQDREFQRKGFCRCLELPEEVNSSEMHAKFRDGVLEVTMPLGS